MPAQFFYAFNGISYNNIFIDNAVLNGVLMQFDNAVLKDNLNMIVCASTPIYSQTNWSHVALLYFA